MRVSQRTLHSRIVRLDPCQCVIHIDGFAPGALLDQGFSELMIDFRQVGIVLAEVYGFVVGRDLTSQVSLLSERDAQLEMREGIGGIPLNSVAPCRNCPVQNAWLSAG